MPRRRRRQPLVRQPTPELTEAYASLRATYPGFANFTTAVTQPLNVADLDYDALLVSVNKRFSSNYELRVSYTLSSTRGNTTGNGVPTSGFQVLDDLHLELNEGPSNFDSRHNFVVSGRAVIPKTGGLNVSWVARALGGTPFTLVNNPVDPDRNGSLTDPLPAGSYAGTGREPLHGRRLPARAQRCLRPRILQPGRAPELCPPLRLAPDRDRRRRIQRDQPHQLREPVGQSGARRSQFLLLSAYSTSYAPRKLQLGARFVF